jgi:hypothetical protein
MAFRPSGRGRRRGVVVLDVLQQIQVGYLLSSQIRTVHGAIGSVGKVPDHVLVFSTTTLTMRVPVVSTKLLWSLMPQPRSLSNAFSF